MSVRTRPKWHEAYDAQMALWRWYRTDHALGGSLRYVWNEEQTRCYVISRERPDGDAAERNGEFHHTWIVKTVLPRVSDLMVEDADGWRRNQRRKLGARERGRGRAK